MGIFEKRTTIYYREGNVEEAASLSRGMRVNGVSTFDSYRRGKKPPPQEVVTLELLFRSRGRDGKWRFVSGGYKKSKINTPY
jgi:hypothetical protein